MAEEKAVSTNMIGSIDVVQLGMLIIVVLIHEY